jgi:hypothetical protein
MTDKIYKMFDNNFKRSASNDFSVECWEVRDYRGPYDESYRSLIILENEEEEGFSYSLCLWCGNSGNFGLSDKFLDVDETNADLLNVSAFIDRAKKYSILLA